MPRRTRHTLSGTKAPASPPRGYRVKSVSKVTKKKSRRALPAYTAPIGLLAEGYGKALTKSRMTGRPVRFVVDVSPEGHANIVSLENASSLRSAAIPVPEEADLDRALAAARERGQLRIAQILQRPDMVSADAFAKLLGTTRATVNTWRQRRQVLALEGATRGFRFPDWQVSPNGRPFSVLPQLFEKFGNSPWAVYRFLIQHHPELDGRTAREALRLGHDDPVLAAADTAAQAFS
jgi:DNA-binding transcriptional regulator YiaG